MAKRSDFAQKLLDDLRLRKERMAASSHTSNNRSNNSMAIDAYSYAKQNYRGSRTNQSIGSRNGTNRSSGSRRSSLVGEASHQIVPYGRGQSSEPIDFSMALAYALENGAKIGRTDSSGRNSMLGFLQQIGRRSIDITRMEGRSNVVMHRPSASQFPAFSPLQIEEISKGAQKLNQILRACSNGINFDSYSIEIGKELLKGAVDLENSLKMLVNLQEASEYMVNPQRKNRIKLLEDDEEEEDESSVKIAQEWQLGLPRFSFDKPSRHRMQELERTGPKQRLPALTNSMERNSFGHEKQAVSVIASISSSHRRSASNGGNSRNHVKSMDPKNQTSSSDSKAEKARIPNVIAKLMGLDNLPESENLTNKHKDSNSKQETAKIVGVKAKGSENLAPPKKQKVVETNKSPEIQNPAFVLHRERNSPTRVNFEVAIHDEKPPLEYLRGIKAATRSEKASTKKDMQQSAMASRMDSKEKQKNQDTKKLGEQKMTGRGDMVPKMEVHAHERLEAAHILQEKRVAEKLLPSNLKKSQNNVEFQQPSMLRKSVSEDEKHRGEERAQSAKQNLQVRKQKGSELVSKSLSKPIHDATSLQQKQLNGNQAKSNKKSSKKANVAIQSEGVSNGRHHDDLARDRSSAELNIHKYSNNRNPDQNLSPRRVESELGNVKARIPQHMEDKLVHEPFLQKAKIAKVHKVESIRRIDELVRRRNGTLKNITRPLRHQTPILKDRKHEKLSSHDGAEQVRDSRPEAAEPNIIKSNRAEPEPTNLAQPLHKEAEKPSALVTPEEDQCKRLREPEMPIKNDTNLNNRQDQDLNCSINVQNELDGSHGEAMDISYPQPLKHEKPIEAIKQVMLTKSENHLKQILIKSQLFLNTAEALFKLDIPIDILHAGGLDHDQESKQVLDCGYELMRRRGRRQELAAHPCAKISISFVKIITFDGLVKQLHKDFEELKFYGRNGKEECEIEEYLPRMLEIDVFYKEPDLNCMWDLGWNKSMFAIIEVEEVIRDIEKHLLNGLLDDITVDLFSLPSFSLSVSNNTPS